jgi:hypothetical protein
MFRRQKIDVDSTRRLGFRRQVLWKAGEKVVARIAREPLWRRS